MIQHPYTLSICPVCFKEIPALILFEDNCVYLQKECSVHGPFKSMVESDASFYRMCKNLPHTPLFDDTSFLDVTDRCNMKCSFCYYGIENENKDPAIDMLVKDVKLLPDQIKIMALAGAEPTVRNDIPELISELVKITGKHISILTNGIRFSSESYLSDVLNSGISTLNMSLHHPDEQTKAIYTLKKKALLNIKNSGFRLRSMMFTVNGFSQVSDILRTMREYSDMTDLFRIRLPVDMWAESQVSKRGYLSTIYRYIETLARQDGASFKIVPVADHSIYHIDVLYNDMRLRIISWPDKYNVDLADLNCGPYNRARSGRIVNVIYSFMINEGIENGYLFGREINQLAKPRTNWITGEKQGLVTAPESRLGSDLGGSPSAVMGAGSLEGGKK